MTPHVIACELDDEVQKAVDLMRDNQVRRIPMVDQQGVIQGMVSTADVLQVQGWDVSSSKTYDRLKKATNPSVDASKPHGQTA